MSEHSKPEMPKAYDPKTVEKRLYKFWEENGWFTPKIDNTKTPYVIIMPPPNVTGALHVGHAQRMGVEDAFIRWRRMNGDNVLWVPGVDHAGISGETVVERLIWQEEKKTKNKKHQNKKPPDVKSGGFFVLVFLIHFQVRSNFFYFIFRTIN